MSGRLYRSIQEPVTEGLSTEELWHRDDRGIIVCWEVGRRLGKEEPGLAERTKNGELPVMGWKGGVEKKIKGDKYGTLKYLALWQGLRNEDLNIDRSQETALICSRNGMKITYTSDVNKYRGA